MLGDTFQWAHIFLIPLKPEKYLFNFIVPDETHTVLAEGRYVEAPLSSHLGAPDLFDGVSY